MLSEKYGTIMSAMSSALDAGSDGTVPARSMRLQDLPPELLNIAALRVLCNGEIYWFAATCRACADAARTVCREKGVPMASRISRVFTSLKRLRRTVQLLEVHGVVHAQMNAYGGTASRPHSLDGLYTWSPAGEKAIAAGAPIEVLDYAWANWVVATDHVNPGCFLRHAAAYGRTDLLTHMDQRADALRLQSAVQRKTLFAILNAALMGCEKSLAIVESAIIIPAIEVSNLEAVRWYYARQEKAEFMGDFFAGDQPKWRRQFSIGSRLDRLTVAAVKSTDPRYTLNQIRYWLWPCLGDQAPLRQMDAHMQMANVVLVSAIDAVDASVGAWEWLEEYESLGVLVLFAALRGEPTNLRCVQVHRRMFAVRSAAVYRWMSERLEPGQWLGDVFASYGGSEPRAAGLWREGKASRRLSFAISIIQDCLGRSTLTDTNDPTEAWVFDEALCIAALSDALIWSWERPKLHGNPDRDEQGDVGRQWMQAFKVDTFSVFEWLVQMHPDTSMDVLREFFARADDEMTCGCEYTKRGMLELSKRKLGCRLRERVTLDAEFAKVWPG